MFDKPLSLTGKLPQLKLAMDTGGPVCVVWQLMMNYAHGICSANGHRHNNKKGKSK